MHWIGPVEDVVLKGIGCTEELDAKVKITRGALIIEKNNGEIYIDGKQVDHVEGDVLKGCTVAVSHNARLFAYDRCKKKYFIVTSVEDEYGVVIEMPAVYFSLLFITAVCKQ